jgi:hypothetical protein
VRNPGYSIIHTIICDDVRREDNGKEILIGVYNGTMVLDSIPTVLPTFAIRILAKVNTREERKVTGSISGPSGSDIVRFEGSLKVEITKYLSSFSFRAAALPINALGRHEVKIGIGSTPKVISSFDVITREQMNAGNPQQK